MGEISVPGAVSVAITCADGVVLGNDRRATWGYMVQSKTAKKVFQLTEDGHIWITSYGLIGDMQALARIMVAQANLYEMKNLKKISVRAMSKMIANFLYQRKMAPLFTNVAVAGVDHEGPAVYTMDAIGSLMQEDYGVAGTGATFAVSILESEWRPEITVEEGVELLKKVIFNSVKRDATTGNAADIGWIKADSVGHESFPIDALGE
jgi:proteasome beta subunit